MPFLVLARLESNREVYIWHRRARLQSKKSASKLVHFGAELRPELAPIEKQLERQSQIRE